MQEVRGSKPWREFSFFVRNPVKAVKKNVSTLKSQKFTAFNTKRCGCFAVKKTFFSPLFTANLTLFFGPTSTREGLHLLIIILPLLLVIVDNECLIYVFSLSTDWKEELFCNFCFKKSYELPITSTAQMNNFSAALSTPMAGWTESLRWVEGLSSLHLTEIQTLGNEEIRDPQGIQVLFPSSKHWETWMKFISRAEKISKYLSLYMNTSGTVVL